MKLEIYDEVSGETQVFRSTDTEVTIGSREGNTLVLATPGISGQHLKITDDGHGNLQVIDLGSSNGTFINNEQLEPNTPTDFNSFFPVVLAKLVNITMLDDHEEDQSIFKNAGAENNTIKKAEKKKRRSTSTGTQTKTSINSKRPRRKKKKKKKTTSVNPIIVIACLAIASYFAFTFLTEEEKPAQPVLKKVAVKKKPKRKKQKKKVTKKAPNQKLSLPNQQIIINDKCLLQEEKSFCQFLRSRSLSEGFFIANNVLYMAVDGVRLYNQIPKLRLTGEMAQKVEKILQTKYGRFYKPGNAEKAGFKVQKTITPSQRAILGVLYYFRNKNFTQELMYNNDINALEILVTYNSNTAKPLVLNQFSIKYEDFKNIHLYKAKDIDKEIIFAKRTYYMDKALEIAEKHFSSFNESKKKK